MFISLTSSHNPKFREVLDLKQAHKRRKLGLYLIEGVREVERFLIASTHSQAQADPQGLVRLFISESAKAQGAWESLSNYQDRCGELICLSDALFEKLSHRESPDGVLAIA